MLHYLQIYLNRLNIFSTPQMTLRNDTKYELKQIAMIFVSKQNVFGNNFLVNIR